MGSKFHLVMAGLWATASIFSGVSYGTKPHTPELQMMKATAEYIQEYKGGNTAERNPMDALKKAQEAIKIVGEGDVKVEGLSKLEKDTLSLASSMDSKTPPQMYGPALKQLGEKMEDVADPYMRSNFSLVNATLQGSLALFNLGLYIKGD